MPPPTPSCSLSRPTRPLCSVWALEVVSRGLCPVHWSWKKSVSCLVMEQDVSASQEWWEVFWVSRERDHPLEATSSEEVKAAFVWLLSAACLVIIPLLLYEHRPGFPGEIQPYWPTEECTTHRQQRLTSHSAAEMPDWGRHGKHMKPCVGWRAADEQTCTVRLMQTFAMQ